MAIFTQDYDPGLLNVPGFGQSATNPLPPVYYDSLGIVKDLSVFGSLYGANSINAKESFNIGNSYVTTKGANVTVPATFTENVTLQRDLTVRNLTTTKRLVVNGLEYKETVIVGRNGTFRVLASI